MIDHYYIIEFRSRDDYLLASFEADETDNYYPARYPNLFKSGDRLLKVRTGQQPASRTDTSHYARVFLCQTGCSDYKLWAKIELTGDMEIKFISGQTPVFKEIYVYERYIIKDPVCTCGGWAVYGRDADIHADTVANVCDLRKK